MRPVRDILLEDEELERGFRAQADVPTDELIESVTEPIVEEQKTADNADGHIDETEEVTDALQQDEMAPTVAPQDEDPEMDEIDPDDVPSIEPETQLASEQDQDTPEPRELEAIDDGIPDVPAADLDDFEPDEAEVPDEIPGDVRAVPDGDSPVSDDLTEPETNQPDDETFDDISETSDETFQSFPEPVESEPVEMDDFVEPQSESSTTDGGRTPDAPASGFMGIRDLPTVSESKLEEFEASRGTSEEQVQRRIEMQMKANEDLASQLAIELEPQFDEIREQQAQATRDYVQRQIVLNSLMRQG